VYAVITPFHSLRELNRQSQPSRRGCRSWELQINRSIFADDLVHTASLQQGLLTLDQFFAVCHRAEMKISAKILGYDVSLETQGGVCCE